MVQHSNLSTQVYRLSSKLKAKMMYTCTQTQGFDDVGGSVVIAPPFLILASDSSESSASHFYRFTSGETAPRYPLYKSLCGPQCRPRHHKEKKNFLRFQRIEPRFLGGPARCQVFTPTELSQLRNGNVISMQWH